jgi:hypothetical protein
MEFLEEVQKLVFVPTQNRFYLRWLFGVRNEHLAGDNVSWLRDNVERRVKLTLNTWNASN